MYPHLFRPIQFYLNLNSLLDMLHLITKPRNNQHNKSYHTTATKLWNTFDESTRIKRSVQQGRAMYQYLLSKRLVEKFVDG